MGLGSGLCEGQASSFSPTLQIISLEALLSASGHCHAEKAKGLPYRSRYIIAVYPVALGFFIVSNTQTIPNQNENICPTILTSFFFCRYAFRQVTFHSHLDSEISLDSQII